jgi:hypothetical protein
MRVSITLLLAAAVLAEGPELSVALERTPVRTIAARLTALSGTKIEVSPEYADKIVTLDMKATVENIVRALAKKAGGEFHRDADGTLHVVPAWQARILPKLTKKLTRVSWDADEFTVNDACQYLRSVAGLNLVLDDSVLENRGIGVDAANLTVRDLLDLVAVRAKAQWRLRFGVVHLAKADRFAELPTRVAWQDEKLLQKEIDVPFNATRFTVVIAYCKAATGIDIVLSPEARDKAEPAEVTLLASKVTLAQILALTLPPLGLKARVVDGVVKIEVAR